MKKLFFVLILFGFSIHAQDIAYVDSRYILENIPEFNTAQEELNNLSTEWEEEINLMKEDVERLYRNYQAEQYLLPENKKRDFEKKIIEKEQEIKSLTKLRFGPDGELYKKQEQLIRPIMDLINTAITKFADEGEYDIIFDKSSDLIMIFANPELDKSEAILEKLGY
tara:strand:+ start:1499 stop:1999 length:501 start_codon:yes stop_codon:yes gene_type:complete